MKKDKTVIHSFIKIVNESKHKPSNLWFDQKKEFYNNCMQKLLDDSHILMYLNPIESNLIVADDL